MRPEFLSRVDEIVVFRNLTKEDFVSIAGLMLSEYTETLREKGITFVCDESIKELIAEKSFGGRSGARDIRNYIRRHVEDKLASIIIERGEEGVSGISLTADKESGEPLLLTL